jgi:hypothetical protein
VGRAAVFALNSAVCIPVSAGTGSRTDGAEAGSWRFPADSLLKERCGPTCAGRKVQEKKKPCSGEQSIPYF